MVEALGFAVADRPVGEQGCEAHAAGRKQVAFAGYVQECLLLAGETRIRQILCSGAGPDGNGEILVVCSLSQFAIEGTYLGREIVRPAAAQEGRPDPCSGFGQAEMTSLVVGEFGGDAFLQAIVCKCFINNTM